MNKPLPLSFYLRVLAPRMFVMQALAPSVSRLIVVHDPGCSPVGNSVPWCWVPERLWEFAPSAEAGLGVAASLSHGKQKLRLWPQFKTQPLDWA